MTVALIANVVGDLTEQLQDWAANWWFVAVIFAVAFLDSFLPLVPSETTVIIGGVAVATGDARYALWTVMIAGAVGAFRRDNFSYTLGHRFGGWFHRRAEHRPRLRSRLEWADSQIRRRGGPLLVTARFIPGGRTALTLSSGITRQRRWWFVRWVALATVLWAVYAAGLAYVIGRPFEDNHTLAFWIAFGTALAVNIVIEVVRHTRSRRSASVA